MKHTMRILTFLLLMVVGAGQTWAMALEPSNIKRGTITGGSIAFYADEACTSDFEGDVAANATVYVKATPEPGNTAIGVTFTAKKGISTDAMQAPRRSAESPGIAADITVSAVTGKPGIYSFTMPNAENTNVTINATFATPAQQLVSYVDENYETHEVDAYVLDETMSVLPVGFYVVPDGGVTFSHSLSIAADANLILRDGATMTVDGTIEASDNHSLTIYAQTAMTGQLTVTTYACGVILVPHFVAYSGDYATAFIAAGTVSDANKTTINGKTLKPLAGNAFTKYVPQDKSGSYTMALPALPEGASYSFTKTDASGVINTYSYDAQNNTLTYTTNSGKTSGTTGAINVAATGATNNNDYSFTLNVTVSEYTTAYGWPEQTNIWLDADNELVWAEGGVTLNTALLTVKKGSTTITDYTVKMGDTELTAGENLLTLDPGAFRIAITGDDGKLDDWVDFKVIQLNENDAKLTMDIPLSYVLPGVVTEPNTTVYYDGNNVTSAENTKLWYRHEIGEYYTSHLNDELYENDTYSTRQTNVDALSGAKFTIGTGYHTDMHISNFNGSTSLDGVSRIDAACGQLILHREGEAIKQKLDLNDVPVSSGVEGGCVYYVGIDCPDFYLKEGKVYYQDETGEHLANKTNDNNEVVTYAITDGKDIFYAGGAEIFQYGNFVSFGENRFNLDDTPGVLTCASRKTIGWECHCQKDANGDCVSCFSQNGDILTVCGETIHLGQYILVGPNFVVLGDKYLYDFMPPSEGHVGPDLTKINAVFDADSHILTVAGYEINVGNRPICWVDDVVCTAQVYYPTMNYDVFLPCAYVKYRTGDCCYSVARKDYVTIPYSSALSIQCDSQYKVGDDINITFTVSGCEDEYGNTDGKGSTGAVIVYLNNEYKSTLSQAPYEYNPDGLAEGTYVLRVKQHGDETHRGAETTTTFTVVRTDPVLTLTGSQNTAGKPFESGANIEYDPENPIVVNAVNDKTVSNTYWRWQISNTSDADVVKIDHTVNKSGQNNKNSEDIYLNTIGLGEVTLTARFSGNEIYNPARKSITFKVVPKAATLFAANSTNLWATFCDIYERTVPDDCTAYTISSISGSTVTLSDALTTTIPAYTPVLVKRESSELSQDVKAKYNADGTVPANYNSTTGIVTSTGSDFTFYGNCLRSDVSADDFKGYYNEGQTYLLYNGKFIQADENGGLGAHKCLLVLNGTNNAPVLSISEEITSLTPIPSPKGEGREYFYTLDGRKLDGKPTKKGLYIHNGRKVVIK